MYASWGFTQIGGCGWGWAAAVWVWDIVWFLPMDILKITVRTIFESYEKKNVGGLFLRNKRGMTGMDVFRSDPISALNTPPASTVAAGKAQARAALAQTYATSQRSISSGIHQMSQRIGAGGG